MKLIIKILFCMVTEISVLTRTSRKYFLEVRGSEDNMKIILSTIKYIMETGRFA